VVSEKKIEVNVRRRRRRRRRTQSDDNSSHGPLDQVS